MVNNCMYCVLINAGRKRMSHVYRSALQNQKSETTKFYFKLMQYVDNMLIYTGDKMKTSVTGVGDVNSGTTEYRK